MIPFGPSVAKAQIALRLAQTDSDFPQGLRPALPRCCSEITSLEEKILSVERQLAALTRADERARQLREIPGVGLLTSTALLSTVGDIQRFPSGRILPAGWGLLPANDPVLSGAVWARSPSKETCTAEHSWYTARDPRC